MNRKAIIFGIKGPKLSIEEKFFLKKQKPWGIILFSRNIENLKQLKLLINDIKKLFKDNYYPIIIDQEGGRVSRLNKLLDFSTFSQAYFENIYKKNKKHFLKIYQIYIDTVCHILKNIGVNINTVPVLDLRKNNGHDIIGDRSFSNDPIIVSKMGNLCVDLYKKNKIGTVIKHIPGHGGAKSDSHFFTPIVTDSKNKLIRSDFVPFKKCDSLFAMTAHIIYKSYDKRYPCTHSKTVINEIIRNHMNFKGLVITDDISMGALKLGLRNNAIKALDAGCNLILHCNGNIKEMSKLAKIVPTVNKFIQKKTEQFYKFLM